MDFNCVMLVVEDIKKSTEFYKNVLNLKVLMDLGANVSLTKKIALQTKESYAEFIGVPASQINFKGNNYEIYFEENNFDAFLIKLDGIPNINYVHKVKEHSWGQRVVRFYDLDGHIIEVGENLKNVVLRFSKDGLTPSQIAKRMDVPMGFVEKCLK